MKRIYLLSAAVTLIGAVLTGTPVSAAFTCEVGYTGPNSQNMCESVETYQCSINNQNNVKITDSTNQEAYSGNVAVEDNGSGGSASSGSVTNNTGTTFTITITNGSESTETPRVCTVSAFVPAKETPEAPTPGKGESSTPVTPSRTVTPQALPVTSGSNVPAMITLVGSVALVAIATAAYRRLHL